MIQIIRVIILSFHYYSGTMKPATLSFELGTMQPLIIFPGTMQPTISSLWHYAAITLFVWTLDTMQSTVLCLGTTITQLLICLFGLGTMQPNLFTFLGTMKPTITMQPYHSYVILAFCSCATHGMYYKYADKSCLQYFLSQYLSDLLVVF